LLQFTLATHYALEALTYLAAQPPDAVVPSHSIARERGLPERFLLKILKPLAGAGLLRSVKGPNGGYRLLRPAREVSVLEVAVAVEPGFLVVASERGGRVGPYLEGLVATAADAARTIFAKHTLADCLAVDGKAPRKRGK
jgi:Rrf2 family protein